MTHPATTDIYLTEYETATFDQAQIPWEVGERLYRQHGAQVNVEFPSPKTHNQWTLTSQGWVGYIPLDDVLSLRLEPKVPLHNLFGMLEYAYRLKSFQFLDADLMQSDSLEAFYERLAHVLARRVLDRGRKGFHQAYVGRVETLPYVAGRVDMRRLMQRPWDSRLRCHYENQTADIADNQILAWTLRRILRSGLCTERTLPTLRQAYRIVQSFATLYPYTPQDCLGRLYNRLNDDYQPLHALCRFFLEHSGPTHEAGDRTFLPFLVNMARLYELFVAEWLKQHLNPTRFQLKAQETVTLGEHQDLHFNIDLTLYDVQTQTVLCILDTKYKTPDTPPPGDLFQIIAYADFKQCQDACLIYPQPLTVSTLKDPLKTRVHCLTFSLTGDLEANGRAFVDKLFKALRQRALA